MYKFLAFAPLFCLLVGMDGHAQASLSFKAHEANLDKSLTLKVDDASEDDPNDLAEAYSYITLYGEEQQGKVLELRFPAHVGTYSWQQRDKYDKNDSLEANLYYDMNPKVYGNVLQAYATDFTIHVNRYDNAAKGVVEGNYKGVMEAYIPGSHQTVSIPVQGNFRTVRGGSASVCRKMRQSEKVVTEHALDILQRCLIERVKDAGWLVHDIKTGTNATIANHPGPFRPLMYCSDFFSVKCQVDPNSAEGRQMADSAKYYEDQASKNSADDKLLVKYSVAMFRVQASQQVSINVDANPPYLKQSGSSGPKDRYTELHVPHAGYAYLTVIAPNDPLDLPKVRATVLLGNWAGADMHAKNYVTYPYKHRQQAPVLETVAVTFHGTESAIDNLIRSIDWDKLNDMLSK